MTMVLTVSKKNIADDIKLDSSFQYSHDNFEPIFLQSIKRDPLPETLFRDVFICKTTKIICVSNLKNKYSVKYENNISDFITTSQFENNDISLHHYSLIVKNDKLNIILHITNQDENYPITSNYQQSTKSSCDSIICENQNKCQIDNEKKNLKCLCLNGYSGISCEHKNYCGWCKDDFCENNIKCNRCPIGLEGVNCDIVTCVNINMCSDHGKCIVKDKKRKCICDAGWDGDYCDIGNCTKELPCFNGGKCISYKGEDKCFCIDGFLGDLCEDKIESVIIIIFKDILLYSGLIVMIIFIFITIFFKYNIKENNRNIKRKFDSPRPEECSKKSSEYENLANKYVYDQYINSNYEKYTDDNLEYVYE